MDLVTHTLTGLTRARAGPDRLGPYSTATLVVAANVPDLGLLYLLGGSGTYLEQPMWTHSLVGGVALGAAPVALRQPRLRPGLVSGTGFVAAGRSSVGVGPAGPVPPDRRRNRRPSQPGGGAPGGLGGAGGGGGGGRPPGA